MTISTVVLVLFVPENKWAKEMLATEVPDEEEEEQNANAGKKLPKDKKRSLIFILLSVFFWYMSYNAINSAFSRYSTSILGFKNGEFASYMLVATIAAVISYLPIGIISSKFGRKKVIRKVDLVYNKISDRIMGRTPKFMTLRSEAVRRMPQA